jgi:hypothetical protein
VSILGCRKKVVYYEMNVELKELGKIILHRKRSSGVVKV